MFERNYALYSIKEQLELHKMRAIVLGCGGGGCSQAEILVRAGIGDITLVDYDTFEESNLNRQLAALHSTLGMKKPEALATRLLDINPNLKVHIVCDAISEKNYKNILKDKDIIIDTVDKAINKHNVCNYAKSLGKVYATGGLGGYRMWAALLEDKHIDDVLHYEGKPEQSLPTGAGPVMMQAALQTQLAINYALGREVPIDMAVNFDLRRFVMSVEEIF